MLISLIHSITSLRLPKTRDYEVSHNWWAGCSQGHPSKPLRSSCPAESLLRANPTILLYTKNLTICFLMGLVTEIVCLNQIWIEEWWEFLFRVSTKRQIKWGHQFDNHHQEQTVLGSGVWWARSWLMHPLRSARIWLPDRFLKNFPFSNSSSSFGILMLFSCDQASASVLITPPWDFLPQTDQQYCWRC